MRDAQALGALVGEWDALLGRATASSAFLTHGWMRAWWGAIGSRTGTRSILVLAARATDGRLAGILPLLSERMGFGPLRWRVLRLLGTGPTAPEHLDAIVDRSDPDGILAALLGALSDLTSEYDALALTDLGVEGLLPRTLPGWAAEHGFVARQWVWEKGPYVCIAGTFDDYLASLSSKHRYKIRHFDRRLAANHELEMTVASTPEEVAPALEELFRLHALRWSVKRRASTFDTEPMRAFHRQAASAMAASDAVRVFLLKLDGRAVAACYCLHWDRHLYFYQPGFDPRFAKFHVGKVLLARVLSYCYDQQQIEFDFLRGEERYKFDWTHDVRSTLACDVAVSARGRAWLLARSAMRNARDPILRRGHHLAMLRRR